MSAGGMRIEPGTIFARDFRVQRFLAAGGMGAVYVAEQLSTGKERALKVMHDPLVDEDGTRRDRFLREARVGARIESDHVIEVVAAGVDDDTGMPWLAMELLKGQDLARRLKERGPFSIADVHEIFRQLCHGLEAAHRAGLVHRDLKPDNVFLAHPRRDDVPFTVKILDFGLATAVRGEDATRLSSATVAGSPMWMAPEQVSKQYPVSPATDVWALGLLAFRLLTGRYYWRNANRESGSIPAVLSEMLMEPVEPASQRAHELGVDGLLPRGFDEWFARCLQREPDARFRSAALALMALSPVLTAHASPGARVRPVTASSLIELSLPLPPQPDAPAAEFPPPPPRLGSPTHARRTRTRRLAPLFTLLTLGGLGLGAYLARERLAGLFRYVHLQVSPVAAPNVDLQQGEAPTAQPGARAPVTPLVNVSARASASPTVSAAGLRTSTLMVAPAGLERADPALARRVERAYACIRRFNYACASSALAGHGTSEEELALVVMVAHGQRRTADERRAMQAYLARYPQGPRADEYRTRLAAP